METIVWVGAVLVVVLFYWFYGLSVIRKTSDPSKLRKYREYPIFYNRAMKRLAEVYVSQLDGCASSKVAYKIANATCRLVPESEEGSELHARAWEKYEELVSQEKRIELTEIVNDEEKLILFIFELNNSRISENDSLRIRAMESLFPFTAKRIQEAKTVKDLANLKGVKKIKDFLFWDGGLNRIDDSLKPLFNKKLKRLVLCEAIGAVHQSEAGNMCFRHKTGDIAIDNLVAMKMHLLMISLPQSLPNWTSNPLRDAINHSLMRFLEQESERCS